MAREFVRVHDDKYSIWIPDGPSKPVAKLLPQQRIDVSQISAEQIRKRAAQLEQERRDNEQRLKDTSILDHAARSPKSQEEIAAEEAARRKAHEYRMERLRQVMH